VAAKALQRKEKTVDAVVKKIEGAALLAE